MLSYLIAAGIAVATWTWIVGHQLIAGWIAAVMIDQLPAPAQNGNAFYRWFFGVTQIFAANLNRGWKGTQGQLSGGQGPKV